MDGLAAGASLFGTLAVFAAALMTKNAALAMAALPLAGCLFGFLFYNFNPASIFPGDSGSLPIGFLPGCFGIVWTEHTTPVGMTAPLPALALAAVDVGLTVARRAPRDQPIFAADRGHIHHRLPDRGMSPKKAAVPLYGVCSTMAVFSLLSAAPDAGLAAVVGHRVGRSGSAGVLRADRDGHSRAAIYGIFEGPAGPFWKQGAPRKSVAALTAATATARPEGAGRLGSAPTQMSIEDDVRWHPAAYRPAMRGETWQLQRGVNLLDGRSRVRQHLRV